MTNPRNALAFRWLSMPGLTNAALAGWLPEFNLNVADPLKLRQELFCLGRNPLALTLGKAWK